MIQTAALVLYFPLRAAAAVLWGLSAIVHSAAEELRRYYEGERHERRAYEISREWTFEAGRELGRLAAMLVDRVSNTAQLFQFMAGGWRAVTALAATSITGPSRERVYSHVAEGFLHELNQTVLALPPESKPDPHFPEDPSRHE